MKTIGDAVMASFVDQLDALRAALDMQARIARLNAEPAADRLKIGLHDACLAVTLSDRLDYFGQTVNIAARVQALAGADEVVVTDDVLASGSRRARRRPRDRENRGGAEGDCRRRRRTSPARGRQLVEPRGAGGSPPTSPSASTLPGTTNVGHTSDRSVSPDTGPRERIDPARGLADRLQAR